MTGYFVQLYIQAKGWEDRSGKLTLNESYTELDKVKQYDDEIRIVKRTSTFGSITEEEIYHEIVVSK